MANQEQLDILKQGVDAWNQWREKYIDIQPDLRKASLFGADLSAINLSNANFFEADLRSANLKGSNLSEANFLRADLRQANFSGSDLSGAHFHEAILSDANLSGAILSGADLRDANLNYADLRKADLKEAYLFGAKLIETDLRGADLSGAYLAGATLVRTDLRSAILTECSIHGISAWSVKLEGAKQDNLVITRAEEPTITVDNLEIAQFIYLLLNYQKIRQTIDTITSQVVLILGSFPSDRKEVIDTLSTELHSQKYSPVVFNFEGAENKDFTATVRTLANMARFVLLDLTNLGDAIREIADEILPRCVVPIQPLLLQDSYQQGYERFLGHKHRWVLAPYRYKDLSHLQNSFRAKVLQPIDEKMIELKQKNPLRIFIGYAPEDKNMLRTLKAHLRSLVRAGLIELWDDQDVVPGEEKREEIARHLSEARIILLLISPAFLDSQDCYDLQMSIALERHEQGEARVIPILLRPCAWQSTRLKDLQPLPKDGKPVSRHNKQDDVFFEVGEGIAEAIKTLG